MKVATVISRVLLGLGFFVFGLNIVVPFLNAPPPPEGSLAAQFMGIMVPSHWMAVIGLVQVIGGVLVLTGRTTPLGLVFLGPVLVNILAFHICLLGGHGIAPGLVFTALELFLIYAYRGSFSGILSMSASPTQN